jgi:PilZ domain-containing protein
VKGRDRRGAARARADWAVTLETFERGILEGHVLDVSTSGVRVRVGGDLAVGAAVTLRITLPRGANRLEVVARVTRRETDSLALDFIGLPETEARRVEPLVGGWDTRRRGPRATRPVPVSIRVGRGETGQGKTLDLSAFGARIATDLDLKPGDFAKLEFHPEADGEPLRLSAVVWSLADRGAVFVFANLRMSDFTRLNHYVGRMVERGS